MLIVLQQCDTCLQDIYLFVMLNFKLSLPLELKKMLFNPKIMGKGGIKSACVVVSDYICGYIQIYYLPIIVCATASNRGIVPSLLFLNTQ